MFNQRQLNDNELKFITKQINSTKNLLLCTFLVLVVIVGGGAILIYSDLKESNFAINIAFGTMILLLSGIYWAVVGYSKHKVNPQVLESRGVFKRIYVDYGKNGKYHDTINGQFVKIPWHWRKFLKSQNEPIDYEYIVRDDAFDMGENAFYYVVSVNNELSLDYEMNNGLYKAKPLSFINIVSLLLVLPVVLILCVENGLSDALRINELFKTEDNTVVVNSTDKLLSLTKADYIELKDVWVYQFKRPFDYSGNYAVISQAERDRIYNHPDANASYRYYFSPRMIEKPNKEAFEKKLKESPIYNKGVFKGMDEKLWEKGVDDAFNRALRDYQNRFAKAQRLENILEELKPKEILLKLSDNCIDVPEALGYTIKKGLKLPITVRGFYNPKSKKVISFEEQEKRKERLKENLIPVFFCFVVLLLALLAIFKMIRNTLLKQKLVEDQLNINTGDPRLYKRN
jgi:hypothetical protein